MIGNDVPRVHPLSIRPLMSFNYVFRGSREARKRKCHVDVEDDKK